MQDEPRHFDICGPLPGPGVTILEASAGTGKTFTIAALVMRLVAEGVVPLSDILAVTFTRMATGELRDRVRERLVTAERGLARWMDAGEDLPDGDLVLQLMADGSPESVALRRRRLTDRAGQLRRRHHHDHTWVLPHGPGRLGGMGGSGSGRRSSKDPTDLVEEVVDDLFVRHVLLSGRAPFRRRQAVEAGLAAVKTPDAPLDPAADPGDSTSAGLRPRLGAATRRRSAGVCSTPTS